MKDETEVVLTEEQQRKIIEVGEQRWIMAQKINEIGQYGADSATKLQQALIAGGYSAPDKEQFMAHVALVVALGKAQGSLTKEDLAKFIYVTWDGVNSAFMEPEMVKADGA